jgi:mono/diheme cytochrome c family protein
MITQHVRRFSNARSILRAAAAMFVGMLAVVAGASGQSSGTVVSAQTQPSDTYKNVYDGWKWWHVYCYRCHGVDAIGTTNAPNLTDPNEKLSAAEFLKIVRDGRPDKGMQAWDKLLDNKQIGQIHLYVQARSEKVLPPGRPDEVGPNKGAWVPPAGWPKR